MRKSERVLKVHRDTALAILQAGPWPSLEVVADIVADAVIQSQGSTRWVVLTNFGNGAAYGPYATQGTALRAVDSGLMLGSLSVTTLMRKGGTVDDCRVFPAHVQSALSALKGGPYATLEEAANEITIRVIETVTPMRWIAIASMKPPVVYGMFASGTAARSYCRKLGVDEIVLPMLPVPREGHRKEDRPNGW